MQACLKTRDIVCDLGWATSLDILHENLLEFGRARLYQFRRFVSCLAICLAATSAFLLRCGGPMRDQIPNEQKTDFAMPANAKVNVSEPCRA